jgi:hypothetical protein
MEEDITAYILTKLSRQAPEDDLIYSVCQKTGLDWGSAQELVEQVRNEHAEDIETSQIHLKTLLSFFFYAVGFALTLGPIIYLWFMLDFTNLLLTVVSGQSKADPETVFQLIRGRCLLLGWLELPSILFTTMVGIAIIIVNGRYMGDIWEIVLRKWKVTH